ncbi:MAG: peptidoglycan-binding domain-containing protein [Pseudomonadota bacterium]
MRDVDVRPDRHWIDDVEDADAGTAASRGPLQFGALIVGFLAVTAIVANAAFFQSGRHPAPIFETRNAESGTATPVPVKSVDRILPKPIPGDKIRQIKTAQSLLVQVGYDAGAVDGVFGNRTRNAILAFERASGFPEAGRVTPLLIKRLKRAVRTGAPASASQPPQQIAVPAAAPTGTEGDATREDILLVQRALSDLGYGPLEIDGLLGSRTAQAIQRFELDRGLPITGRMGDRVIAELVLIGGVNPVAQR